MVFLDKNNFIISPESMDNYIDGVLSDMEAGLNRPVQSGTNELVPAVGQEMIQTHQMPTVRTLKNTSVIVIDAGGTNFRSCLVTFNELGKPAITKLKKQKMPAVTEELSKEDFFQTLATYLEHLKDSADRIGFCFSYAMKILPDGDGQVISFSKEIKAPEVIGTKIGSALSQVLVENGWKEPKKIVLLNDTVAALNAAMINQKSPKEYSSYIGFILGTGMNIAYIENSQIIVCESGKCPTFPRSKFDLDFDLTTSSPNCYLLEKMCSGGYLSSLILLILKEAAKENVLTADDAKYFLSLSVDTFSMQDVNRFLRKSPKQFHSENFVSNAATIMDAVINRAALFAACIVAAAVIKSGEGKSPESPVAILCNGTTFYKAYRLRERFLEYLTKALTIDRKLYFQTIEIENDITLGTAAAAL